MADRNAHSQISYSMVVKTEQEDAIDLPDVDVAFRPSSKVTPEDINPASLKGEAGVHRLFGKSVSSGTVPRATQKRKTRVKVEPSADDVIDLVSDDDDTETSIRKAEGSDDEDESGVAVVDE